MTPNAEAAVRDIFSGGSLTLISELPHYQWFDVPLVKWQTTQQPPGKPWVALPFSNTAVVIVSTFDFSPEEFMVVVLCKQTDAGEVRMEFLRDGALVAAAYARVAASGVGLIVDRTVSRAEQIDALVTNCKDVLASLYAASNAPALVGQIALHPKAASRIAQGRVPTYEWRTVVIEPRKPKTEHKGGTHASPRQHDRRGHWATSKRGKRFWRPPCKVGKASNGTVFHDYVVKGPHAPQTPPPDA